MTSAQDPLEEVAAPDEGILGIRTTNSSLPWMDHRVCPAGVGPQGSATSTRASVRVVQRLGLIYVEENKDEILTETPIPPKLLAQADLRANVVEDPGQTAHARFSRGAAV